MSNFSNFIKTHGIGFTSKRVESRPDSNDWPRDAAHWRYEFRALDNDHTVTGYYSAGSLAAAEGCQADRVLECLAMDVRSVMDCRDALEFAAEFGYDLSTHEQRTKARATFEACQKTARDLEAMLGPELVEILLEMDPDE